jgi:hypothetical protein
MSNTIEAKKEAKTYLIQYIGGNYGSCPVGLICFKDSAASLYTCTNIEKIYAINPTADANKLLSMLESLTKELQEDVDLLELYQTDVGFGSIRIASEAGFISYASEAEFLAGIEWSMSKSVEPGYRIFNEIDKDLFKELENAKASFNRYQLALKKAILNNGLTEKGIVYRRTDEDKEFQQLILFYLQEYIQSCKECVEIQKPYDAEKFIRKLIADLGMRSARFISDLETFLPLLSDSDPVITNSTDTCDMTEYCNKTGTCFNSFSEEPCERFERQQQQLKSRKIQNVNERIDDILKDPATSYWLKESLTTALQRDPVDASEDADLLAEVLDEQAKDVTQQQSSTEPAIELFFANEDRVIHTSARAKEFIAQCAALIKEKLQGEQRRFSLMPYRRPFGAEFLGFDWRDETGGCVGFTINFSGEIQVILPDPLEPYADIAVKDATDAMLLCRFIAEAVNGNSTGKI